jgi:hypothetical protein
MTEPLSLSVINLIARPSDHDGKKVRVIGFCVLAFEGKALYLSEMDFRASITKNALWLETPLSPENQKLSEKVLLVEGTFDATSLGHLGMYSGTIRDVGRLVVWGDGS